MPPISTIFIGLSFYSIRLLPIRMFELYANSQTGWNRCIQVMLDTATQMNRTADIQVSRLSVHKQTLSNTLHCVGREYLNINKVNTKRKTNNVIIPMF